MKWFLFFICLCVAILLEATITTLPLVLVVLFVFAILLRQRSVLMWAFFAGLILDSLTFQTIGESSIFFLLFLTITFLYERKFEITSIPFILVFSAIGSSLYSWIVGSGLLVFQGIISAGLSFVLFVCLKFL